MTNPLPPQYPTIKLSGLYTDPNELSSVPSGALVRAENINVNAASVISGRRGTNKIYGSVNVGSSEIKDFFEYQSTLLVHHNDKISYDSNGAGTFVQYSGTFVEPTDGHLRGVEASRNVYVNTNAGIKVLDTISGTWRAAGVDKALGGSAVVGSTGSGFLANGTSAEYKIVWTYTDANKNLKLGGVSERIKVTNSSGSAQHVELTFTIPDSITTANTFQIYRTKQDNYSTELFLVFERAPTSGEITAQEITFTDNVVDAQLSTRLYTSADGPDQDHAQPPIAVDFVFFKNHMLYANTTNKHTAFLQYVGGLALDNTITIGGRTYTAKASENATNQEFQLTTGTTAAAIEATARSLIRVINKDTGNTTFYAYYNSSVTDPTGKILLQERNIGGSAFAMTSNVASAWLPNLPSSGTSVSSDNLRSINGLMWSRLQRPEAVPYANITYIGSANHPITRIIALRDFVLIFKTDGVWQLYGETAPFAIREYDLTIKNLIVARSAVALSDSVFCSTDKGILVLNGQGATRISDPIQEDLDSLRNFTNFEASTFAVAYESDQKYLLYTVTDGTDENATQAFVYNDKTKEWTTWRNGEVAAGYVLSRDGRDKLYLGSAVADGSNNSNIYQERKNFDRFDFADESYAISITAIEVGGNPLVISVAATTNISVDDSIKQGAGVVAQVVAINGLNLTLSRETTWEVGAAEVYKPVMSVIEFTQLDMGTPGIEKTFDEVIFFFREAKFDELRVFFATNESFTDDYEEVVLTPTRIEGGWALLPFGAGVWGGGPGGGAQPLRVEVPDGARNGNWLNIRIEFGQAFTALQFLGIAPLVYVGSERIT